VADAWRDAVLVLELAAGLHEKEEMLIYDFSANPSLLAGTGLMAFAGFFDVSYRRHDYDYGRTVAQQQLAKFTAQAGSVFANLHWTPTAITPVDQNLNNIPMDQIDQEKRQKVYNQIRQAADDLLQEMGANALEREGILLFFIDGKIKKLLGL
jgi:hypothetical protein